MKRKPKKESVEVARYIPEQMMGAAKFRKRRRPTPPTPACYIKSH